jgi:hypothetical protein
MALGDDKKGMALRDDKKGMALRDDKKGMALRDDKKGMDSLDWMVRQGTEWAVKRMGRDSALVPTAALDSAQARG